MKSHKKVWPHNLSAERAVLGNCLLWEAEIDQVRDMGLEAAHFYQETHRKVWLVLCALRAAGTPIDYITVSAALTDQGQLDEVGGMAALTGYMDGSATSATLSGHVAIIRETYHKRRILEQAVQLTEMALGASTLEQISNEARRIADEAEPAPKQPTTVSGSDLMAEMWERHCNAEKGLRAIPVRSPWDGLNRMLNGGFIPGKRPYLLGGRPKMGKTSAMLDIAYSAALDGVPTLLFQLEMPRQDCADRMVAQMAGVEYVRVMKWIGLSDDERAKVGMAMQRLDGAPIWIDGSPPAQHGRRKSPKPIMTVDGMRATIQRYRERGIEFGLVVVDYVQLIRSPGSGAKIFDRVTAASNGLRELATETGIPFVVGVQLRTRDAARGEPTVDDMKGSGDLEQDCAAAIFCDRPSERVTEKEKSEMSPGELAEASLIVAINGDGPRGKVPMCYDGPRMKWNELDMIHEEPPDWRKHYPQHEGEVEQIICAWGEE